MNRMTGRGSEPRWSFLGPKNNQHGQSFTFKYYHKNLGSWIAHLLTCRSSFYNCRLNDQMWEITSLWQTNWCLWLFLRFSIWQNFEPNLAYVCAIEQIVTVVNGQKLINDLAICSHWFLVIFTDIWSLLCSIPLPIFGHWNSNPGQLQSVWQDGNIVCSIFSLNLVESPRRTRLIWKYKGHYCCQFH